MPNVMERYPDLANATPNEKLALIDELWLSIRESATEIITSEHQAELDQRIAKIDADPTLAMDPGTARGLLKP
ncbi:addiction module protein [Synoicihabitans lomoniglobus]|uniref:Addiction module protein n=1 Tax=Synoicihabitans lomoniglobus TaxID=2909285 RepID=A0AAF0CG96_9BACT|nr:addiction module protein [Opitutaceae bacterium LMO-M01]WED63317.1 addiction module protein [Opitutaceae bacterium LMO-M01]